MKILKNHKLWRGLAAVFAFLLAVAIGLTQIMMIEQDDINVFLGIDTGIQEGGNGKILYESAYGEVNAENLKRLKSDIDDFIIEEVEEGSVLLHNDDVLPLAKGSSISLFGHASYDTLYKDNGAAPEMDSARQINMYNAFTNAGFKVNKTLYDAYANSKEKRQNTTSGSNLGEDPISFYNSSITSTYANYKDAAIVVFARIGGEGFDLRPNDSDGVPQLSLHQREKDLLDHIHQNGFTKIIVLINSGFTMEVHELFEHHVNAVMWMGLPGLTGCQGVANLIAGEVSPSGRLVDTYAKNSISAPAMLNLGDFHFSNKTDLRYMVNAEGIYIGYKYYETRYEDYVLGQGNASSVKGSSTSGAWNYADEVVYSFGYGLSYTTFTQEIVEDGFKYDEDTDTFTIEVKVTNTGDVAGKDVVEVYLQSPYTDYDKKNLVEKASIQLVGFAKTKTIEPGKDDTVTVTVDRYLCASYDVNEAKGYILDEGTYYFAIGTDAHNALNNVLAAKLDESADAAKIARMVGEGDASKTVTWEVEELDTESYKNSAVTGNKVTNAFTGDYATDINDFYDNDVVTYLSRSDWDGTWPITYSNLEASQKLLNASISRIYKKPSDAKSLKEMNIPEYVEGKTVDILLYETVDWEFDDPRWDDFINQIPLELLVLAIDCNYGVKAIPEIGKPRTRDADGPSGYVISYMLNGKSAGSASLYAAPIVAGSSWNVEILEKFGNFYGEECFYTLGNETFGPGLNIHRTPYSGRNFEYFSEDGIFTYLIGIPETNGMAAKGLIAGAKHFAGNDQEVNRQQVCLFMTEQRYRQECLKGFEGAITKGGAHGLMGMMSRIGVKAYSVSTALVTTVLRTEWGFTGCIVTDAGGVENDYDPTIDSMVAGNDIINFTRSSSLLKTIKETDDGYVVELLREINHRFYYTRSHSNLMNGIGADTVLGNKLPWWIPTLFAIDSVIGLVCVGSLVLFVLGYYFLKKKKVENKEENTENKEEV